MRHRNAIQRQGTQVHKKVNIIQSKSMLKIPAYISDLWGKSG